jgi:hypothetical protein
VTVSAQNAPIAHDTSRGAFDGQTLAVAGHADSPLAILATSASV